MHLTSDNPSSSAAVSNPRAPFQFNVTLGSPLFKISPIASNDTLGWVPSCLSPVCLPNASWSTGVVNSTLDFSYWGWSAALDGVVEGDMTIQLTYNGQQEWWNPSKGTLFTIKASPIDQYYLHNITLKVVSASSDARLTVTQARINGPSSANSLNSLDRWTLAGDDPALKYTGFTQHPSPSGQGSPTYVSTSAGDKAYMSWNESVDNRINFDNGAISQRKRTFAALQRGGRNHRDLLLTLPLNTPTKLDIGPNETAIVTLLDANHCPGSVMFLIEGKRGAILHTGDIRAEPAMVSRLARNAHIAPYIFTDGQQKKQLEAVYLDTASFIGTQIVPSKASAVEGLLDMIGMYPEDTLFYLNIWTWGYEDILIGIADRFNAKIHVDRHKYLVLCSVENYHSSPSFSKSARQDVFKNILTCDEHETRFHACERYNQCTTIKPAEPEPKRRTHRNSTVKQVPTKKVVWINPGVVASSNWGSYIQEVNDQLKEGHFVDKLKVPLSRHSTLTELQSLISLLRPKNLYPTSNMPSLEGLDWACLPGVFAECLAPDGYEVLRRSTLEVLRKRFPDLNLTPDGMAERAEQVLLKVGHPDLEQENAVGSDEIEWTEARFQRATKTKEHIETYLPWLFGRQDITSPKTTHGVSAMKTLEMKTLPLAGSPTAILAATTAEPNNIEPVQRNEQMHSPPPESPKRLPNLEEPVPETRAHIISGGRPNKRLRITSGTLSPGASSTPVQPSSSTMVTHMTPEQLPKNHALLDGPLKVPGSNPPSRGQLQARNTCLTQDMTGRSPYTQSGNHIRHSNSTAANPASLTITSKSSTSFSGSDTRERRRISKVKERDIRTQLAKLPPEFSRALAATKSAAKQ
ncbi:unnamed protein product [Rhizoctonia solani]|uniref:Protein artemis n=1 Tax=Rhizoctonia solani TaxID=456999 RepID=A0A8H3B2R6_9AGAM|nr:unnamed protein product [Rhizoctonia solani]